MMKRWLRKYAQALSIGIVFLSIPFVAGSSFRWVTAAVTALAAETSECTKRSVMMGLLRHLRTAAHGKDILDSSHTGATEGEFVQTVTPLGTFWEPDDDGSVVVAQLAELTGKYHRLSREFIEPGDVVLDCGANVGVSAREFLQHGAGLVVAFEPSPKNIECLRRNLRREIETGKVLLVEKGVWSEETSLKFYLNPNSNAEHSFVTRSANAETVVVPVTTIDSVVRRMQFERVDFIKMDIEGAEPEALAGAEETLRRYRPHLELEVSKDLGTLVAAARRGWPGYKVECLVCSASSTSNWFRPRVDLHYVWLY